jgi:hypothetical protein
MVPDVEKVSRGERGCTMSTQRWRMLFYYTCKDDVQYRGIYPEYPESHYAFVLSAREIKPR